MIKTCQQCRTDFEAKRMDTKYCGEACKQKNKRLSVSPTQNVSPLSDTVNERDLEIRKKLVKCFQEEGKMDVNLVMDEQDDCYRRQGAYFIPNRFKKHFE